MFKDTNGYSKVKITAKRLLGEYAAKKRENQRLSLLITII